MKAEQLALVEKQYLQKRLLEEFRIAAAESLLFFLTDDSPRFGFRYDTHLSFPREPTQNRIILWLMS